MAGRLVLQGVLVLWLVQAAHTGGYGALYGASTGQGPQPNGNVPQRGGRAGSFLIPSKGVGRTSGQQNGYVGYPTKGTGSGAVAGMNKGAGMNGGNQAALSTRPGAMTNGPYGYGPQAGPAIGQQLKGYTNQAASYGGQGTKGGNLSVLPGRNGTTNGYGVKAGPANLQNAKGNGAAAASQSGFGTKGNGYGVISGPTTGIKGYGPHAGAHGGQRDKGNGYGAHVGGYEGQGTKGNGQGLVAGASRGNGAWPDGQRGHGGNLVKGYGRPHYMPARGTGHFRGPQPGMNQAKAYGSNGYNGYRTPATKGFNGGYGGAALGPGPQYGNGAKGPMKGYGASAGAANGRAGVRSPNGYGNPRTGAVKAAKTGFSSILNGHGAMPNGYGSSRGAAERPQLGYSNGAISNGFGSNPKGYGAATGAVKGFGPQMNGRGVGSAAALGAYGHKPEGYGLWNGKGQAVRGADLSHGKTLKGGAVSSRQQSPTAIDGGLHQGVRTPGEVAAALNPASSIHYQVTNEKYQQLPLPGSQDRRYAQTQLNLESNPESAPYPGLQPGSEPAPLGLLDKGQKGTKYGAAPEPGVALHPGYMAGNAVPEQNSAESDVVFGVDGTADPAGTRSIKPKAAAGSEAAESTENIPPEETLSRPAAKEAGIKSQPETAQGSLPANGRVSVSSGQGAKPNKPDCGPTGQWMKRFKSGNGGGAGLYLNGGGVKVNKPGYGQEVYPAAGYGNLYGGNLGPGKPAKSNFEPVNNYGVVGQPDYATLGQVMPAAKQSGGTSQIPVVPAGIDGISQMETQPAGLLPNGAPPSGQTLGMTAEKSNSKYGVGGQQFGQPVNLGFNGAGNYGYGGSPYVPAGAAEAAGQHAALGVSMGGDPVSAKYGYDGFLKAGQLLGLGSNGNIPGQHGYGTLHYEDQPAGLTPDAKSTGQYGLIGSPYQPAPSDFGYNGKSTAKYDGQELPYSPQTLGFGGEAKSGKYADKQQAHQSQPLESAAGDTTGRMYDHRTAETEPAQKPYVKGEAPPSAFAVQENVGYTKGHVKPDALSPTLEYPADLVGSFSPDEAVQDLSDAGGTAGFLDPAAATETRGEAHASEHPDDLQPPRQIQIQQHLKLHFHPQGGKKYDLNGFFGNSDDQD